jgi:hypothetical protein
LSDGHRAAVFVDWTFSHLSKREGFGLVVLQYLRVDDCLAREAIAMADFEALLRFDMVLLVIPSHLSRVGVGMYCGLDVQSTVCTGVSEEQV